MCDKMAISAYILKIVEKDPFLRRQMRAKVAYRVLDQWRLFYKLYPIFMHFLLINACSACKCHQCFLIL